MTNWFKSDGGIFLPPYLRPGAGETDILDSEILRREPWSDESLNQDLKSVVQRHSGVEWLVWLRSGAGMKLSDYLNDGFETHLSATECTCSPGGVESLSAKGQRGHLAVTVTPQ